MVTDSKIVHLSDSNFDNEVVKYQGGNGLVLVDFWAEWCAPCKMISSILEEISNEFGDKIKIGKLNIDNNSLTIKTYNIRSIPTLLLFRNSMVISTKIGVISKKQLQEFLSVHMSVC